MIRVTESEWERGDSPRIHEFPSATDFNVQPNGALLVLGLPPTPPDLAVEPAGPAPGTVYQPSVMIAAFSDGAWDAVVNDPDVTQPATVAQVPGPPTAESSDPSTAGASSPSTDIPDAADPTGGPEASAPPGSETEGVGSTEPDPVMTPVGADWQPGVDPTVLEALEQPVAPPAPLEPPGMDAGANRKVVMDGQGNPVVMEKNPDGTWRVVSPDDLAVPAGVQPGLVEGS